MVYWLQRTKFAGHVYFDTFPRSIYGMIFSLIFLWMAFGPNHLPLFMAFGPNHLPLFMAFGPHHLPLFMAFGPHHLPLFECHFRQIFTTKFCPRRFPLCLKVMNPKPTPPTLLPSGTRTQFWRRSTISGSLRSFGRVLDECVTRGWRVRCRSRTHSPLSTSSTKALRGNIDPGRQALTRGI